MTTNSIKDRRTVSSNLVLNLKRRFNISSFELADIDTLKEACDYIGVKINEFNKTINSCKAFIDGHCGETEYSDQIYECKLVLTDTRNKRDVYSKIYADINGMIKIKER